MLETIYFEVPELNLTKDHVEELLNLYNSEEGLGYYYSNDKGMLTDLLVVWGYDKNLLIQSLENKFYSGYLDGSYFVSNYGSTEHQDDNRKCVISVEIQNEHNIPVTWRLNNIEYDLYYNNKAVAIDVTQRHSSRTSPTKRIFFQFHLNEKHSFAEYKELYQSGRLLRRNS